MVWYRGKRAKTLKMCHSEKLPFTAPPISKGPENWPPELVIFASTILKLHNPLYGSHFCVTLHSLHTWYPPFYAGHVYTHSHYRRSLQCCWNRDRRGGGAVAPFPEFGRSVNPISTRGADYAHHSTTCPPDFWPLLHPCKWLQKLYLMHSTSLLWLLKEFQGQNLQNSYLWLRLRHSA